MQDDKEAIKRLEDEAYAAMKAYFEAKADQKNLETRDISFYVTAFCSTTTVGQMQFSGHMLTPMNHEFDYQSEEIPLKDMIIAGWPTVATGLCAINAMEFYQGIMEHLETMKQDIHGFGHA